MNLSIVTLIMTIMVGIIATITTISSSGTIPNEANADEKYDCNSLSEPDDYFYCDEFDWSGYTPDKETVDEFCDASEDYARNPKNCDKAYDLVEEKQDKDIKDTCKEVDGKLNKNGECETDGDGPKSDEFEEKMTEKQQIEEIAKNMKQDPTLKNINKVNTIILHR